MKRVGKIVVVLFISAVCAIFMLPQRTSAISSDLIINEIYPAPLSGEKEWVELYNQTDDNIDLSLYELKDGAVAAKNLIGSIEAHGYHVFETSSGWLNNSGEIIFLLEKSSGDIIDKAAYGDWETAVLPGNTDTNPDDNAPAPETEKSISRIPNGVDSDIDKDDFRIVPVSRGTENLLAEYSDQICINEILPEPETGSSFEYIELFNQSASELDISGWQIDDIEGGSTPYTVPDSTIIIPGGYLLFYHSETGISLNDSGDKVRLIDPNGAIKSQLSYNNAKRGQAYALFGQEWRWTTSSTPLAINVYTAESTQDDGEDPVKEQPISEAKKLEIGAGVIIFGTVTVVNGILSNQFFYIEDGTGGIQVYSYQGEFPMLKAGDILRIRGELAKYYGELRIKIFSSSDIQIIGYAFPPKASTRTLEELYEEDVGRYIATEGTVISTSGSTFIISGSPQLKVLIRDGAQVVKPRLKKGNRVKVSGIISSYNGALRILPFGDSGVILLSSGQLPITGLELWNISATILKKHRTSFPIWPADLVLVILWQWSGSWGAARPLA